MAEAITGSPNNSCQSPELLFDVMMIEFFFVAMRRAPSPCMGRICVTLVGLPVIGLSTANRRSPNCPGAAVGRVATELKGKKIRIKNSLD